MCAKSRPIAILVMSFLASLLFATEGLPQTPQVEEIPAANRILEDVGFGASTLIYDMKKDRWMGGHVQEADTAVLPASTFKVFSSLAALETGVIESTGTIIEWDGVIRSREELNRDLDLAEAFRISAVPHYQQLVRKIGEQRMQTMLDAANYGNKNMQGGLDTFWLTGELRISPRQQIGFLYRLYHNDLPFRQKVMADVKGIMLAEQTADYRLRAKTGWAILDTSDHGVNNIGWWVGWVEADDNVWFFATLLQATDPDESFGPARIEATRRILQAMAILPQ